MPAPALGLNYKFFVYAQTASVGYVIVTTAGDNLMAGTYQDAVGEQVSFSGQDTFTFVNAVAQYSDSLEVHSDGVGWHCRAFSRADGGITTQQLT